MKEQKIATSGFVWRTDNHFLIVKRAEEDDFLPGFWELPGGKLEYGEEVTEGAHREIHEETGLDVVVELPIKTMTYIIEESKKTEHHYVEVMFLCRLQNPDHTVVLSSEHQNFRWITFDEIPAEDITDLMKDTLLQLKTHPLISV